MKRKPKKSRPRDPRAVRTRKAIRSAGTALFFCVLLLLSALAAIGLPAGLTARILTRVREAGLPLHAESIRLSPHRGWVFHQARLYTPSPDDLRPLLSAEKLYISVRPDRWKPPFTSWRVGIYVRNASLSLGPLWEETLPEENPFRTVHKLKTSLTAGPGLLTLNHFLLRWGDLTLSAQGSALLPPGRDLQTDSTDLRRAVTDAALVLGRLKYKVPPRLEIDFHYDAHNPEQTRLDAALFTEGLLRGDQLYPQLSAAADLRGPSWTLRELLLKESDQNGLRLRGTYHTDCRLAHLFVDNTLSAAALLHLLPESLKPALEKTGVHLTGRTDFSAEFGPAPAEQLAENIEADVRHIQASRHDLILDSAAFRFSRSGNHLTFEQVQARLDSGSLTGRLEWDLETEAWSAAVQARCNPTPICALIDDDLHEFVQRFRFSEILPLADLILSQPGDGEDVFVQGTLSGEQFTFGGVFLDRMDTLMVYSNRVLALAPLQARRDEKRFDGTIQVDFDRDLAFFNAASSFPPSDIAHILTPGTETFLDGIRFNGPVYAAGSGQIDYGSETNHIFSGNLRAENVEAGPIRADLFDTAIDGRGTKLLFSRSAAQLCKGFIEGSAEFDLLPGVEEIPCRIRARWMDIDLAHMIQTLRGDLYGRTRGRFSGEMNVSAEAGGRFLETAQGGGQVRIDDGFLADLPLFGGFSRLIQPVFPAFNLFSLTSFSAEFELREQTLRSSNAQLGGTLLSARGRGQYSPQTGLDFLVVVQPLRQTSLEDRKWYQLHRWAVRILRKGSSPFFRLLELKLEGPLDQPEWRFVNLPKDLHDRLRRTEPQSP